MPSDNRYWSEGTTFYHFDKVYNRNNVGYRGPTYAYASMPDQYVYAALQRLELGKRDRPPLFAEVDLVSSHEPWTQIPPMIAWNRVGNGSDLQPRCRSTRPATATSSRRMGARSSTR